LSSSGVLSGTPTSSGTFSFGVRVTDAQAKTSAATLNLTLSTSNTSNLASSASSILAQVTKPTGDGSKSLAVIRDGVKPAVGSQVATQQYDTYDGNNTSTSDYIGYAFSGVKTFSRVVYQEGILAADGGWFNGQIKIQVRQNGVWVTVPATVSPAYPGINDGSSYQSFTFTFTPTTGDGIRIYGAPGGSAAFISVGELEVYGTP
jgi:hypothetical protein